MENKKKTVLMPIMSVSTVKGVSKKSGKEYIMHNLYVMLDDGAIGSLVTFQGEPQIGDIAEVGFGMGRSNGYDAPRIEAKLIAVHKPTATPGATMSPAK